MKNIKSIAIVAGLGMAFASCNHHYYVPTSINAPMLTEKNEFMGQLGVGFTETSDFVHFQGAYGITNEVGVMVNGLTTGGNTRYGIVNPTEDYGFGHQFELGVGYHKPFGDVFGAEIYAGYGTAYQKHGYIRDNEPDAFSEIRNRAYFIQPSIGLRTNVVDFIFTLRFNTVDFHSVDTSAAALPENESRALRSMSTNNIQNYFQPGITLRLGYKYLKFQTQLSLMGLSNDQRDFPVNNLNFNIGLTFHFAPRFKTQAPNP